MQLLLSPASTLPVHSLDEGLILTEHVVALERRRLVEDVVGRHNVNILAIPGHNSTNRQFWPTPRPHRD